MVSFMASRDDSNFAFLFRGMKSSSSHSVFIGKVSARWPCCNCPRAWGVPKSTLEGLMEGDGMVALEATTGKARKSRVSAPDGDRQTDLERCSGWRSWLETFKAIGDRSRSIACRLRVGREAVTEWPMLSIVAERWSLLARSWLFSSRTWSWLTRSWLFSWRRCWSHSRSDCASLRSDCASLR